jgi:hypothetical protein
MEGALVNGHVWEVIAIGVGFAALFVPRSTRKILITNFVHPRSRSVMLKGKPPEGTGTILDGKLDVKA